MGNKIKEEFEKHSGCKYLSHRFPRNTESEPMVEISYLIGAGLEQRTGFYTMLLDGHGFWHAAAKIGERVREIEKPQPVMPAVDRGAEDGEIESELYLRDGFPFAVAAKVTLKDGRIGIGIARQDPSLPGALGLDAMDARAREDALENMPKMIIGIDHGHPGGFDPTDLQAQLGQPAHEG